MLILSYKSSHRKCTFAKVTLKVFISRQEGIVGAHDNKGQWGFWGFWGAPH